MSEFIEKVEAASAGLLPARQRFVVAVSGGVDSMVLLHVLHRIAPAHGWRLTVAHLNHQLRGRSSDADENLVKREADRLGLAIIAERADVRKLASTQRLSVEMAARQARHEFLARVGRKQGGNTVVLAHHADDQVELFFVRLLRGAGADGLSGMEPAAVSPVDPRVRLVRPLLCVARGQIEGYARSERVAYREDATNRSVSHLRNRIRHELLPLLEREFQPAIRDLVARTMELLSADADFSWHAALGWLSREPADFDSLHMAVQRRVLQDQLINLGIPPDFFLIERLRCEPQQPVSIGPGKLLLRDVAGRLHVRREVQFAFDEDQLVIDLDARAARVVFDGLELSWRLKNVKAPPVLRRAGTEQFDAGLVGTRVIARHWRKGDRFQPIGMASASKLQDLFANAKVPKSERHQRAVATTASGEIFWVEGLRISERFKLRPETRRVLEWKWRRESRPLK